MRTFLRVVIAATLPLVLVTFAFRVVCLPWLPAWEYSRPGFPPDPFGMSPEERLYLAQLSVYFLNVPHDPPLLAGARFTDGTSAFNERELTHMDDVKIVFDQVSLAGLAALALGTAAAWALGRRYGPAAVWGALCDGGLALLVIVVLLGVVMVLSWNFFFTAFHALFFEADTWLFAYSDTLIRLFPERLWQDVTLFVVILTVTPAFVLALVGRGLQHRLERRAAGPEGA